MNDSDIRKKLKRCLQEEYFNDSNTLIVEELVLRHGYGRVDLAVINGAIEGYEIKSDRDSLKRLPSQCQIYSSVLDRVTLVVGCRHIEVAIGIVPDWWGVQLATRTQDEISFSLVRQAEMNPTSNLLGLTKLLWREEALALLDELDQKKGNSKKTRKDLYELLTRVADENWLRMKIKQQLFCRENWRPVEQQMSYDD